MAARDTRNMAFGIIPLEESPGGDAGLDEWGSDNNVSVRKNFTPVPIYLPNVAVVDVISGRLRQARQLWPARGAWPRSSVHGSSRAASRQL